MLVISCGTKVRTSRRDMSGQTYQLAVPLLHRSLGSPKFSGPEPGWPGCKKHRRSFQGQAPLHPAKRRCRNLPEEDPESQLQQI